MKSIFLSMLLCVVVANVSAQQDNGDIQPSDTEVNAPAGFTWGETKQQIESKGIAVKDCSEEKSELWCIAYSAPKEISFVEEYGLLFIEGYGLQRIVMYTDNFTDDPSGYKGKQLYDEVKQKLISKYGQPTSQEIIGIELYDGHNEFYQCLAFAGCGNWYSYWLGEGSIILQIKGLRRGVGYLNITYESKDFPAIADKQKEAESAKDQEAL